MRYLYSSPQLLTAVKSRGCTCDSCEVFCEFDSCMLIISVFCWQMSQKVKDEHLLFVTESLLRIMQLAVCAQGFLLKGRLRDLAL